jgi:hypothetical protein
MALSCRRAADSQTRALMVGAPGSFNAKLGRNGRNHQ